MSIKKSVVFLAGGLGSRYKGLKQVDGILSNGSPIIEYSLYDSIRAGFNKFVFIISEAVPQSFIDKISTILDEKDLEYHWVIQRLTDFVNDQELIDQRLKPWGTGHAVLCAKDVVKEDFLVVNADDFYGKHSFETAAELIDKGEILPNNYALIAFLVKNTLSQNGSVSRGLCTKNADGKLKSIEELTQITQDEKGIFAVVDEKRRDLQAEDLVSMNFWIFDPSFFNHLDTDFKEFLQNNPGPKSEFFLPTVVDHHIGLGDVSADVQQSHEIWKGVTYPEDKIEVQDFILEKMKQDVYPENLWN